jgi:hypothetical protein
MFILDAFAAALERMVWEQHASWDTLSEAVPDTHSCGSKTG